MAREYSTFIEWRGKEVELRATVVSADPSVGIMGPGLEGIRLIDPDSNVDLPLTESEEQEAMEMVQSRFEDYYYDDGC